MLSTVLTKDIDAVLRLSARAIANYMGIVPNSGEEICADLLKRFPAGWWAKLLVIGVGHDGSCELEHDRLYGHEVSRDQ
jgi:hypothetical protein